MLSTFPALTISIHLEDSRGRLGVNMWDWHWELLVSNPSSTVKTVEAYTHLTFSL